MVPMFKVTITFGERNDSVYCDFASEVKMMYHLYDTSNADQFEIRVWNGGDYVANPDHSIAKLLETITSFDVEVLGGERKFNWDAPIGDIRNSLES